MPQLAEGLGTGIEQIGYLVTVFAIAMAVGGPVLTLFLLRIPPKTALLVIIAVFLVGNVVAALATSYPVMVIARIISGVASQAFFGIAVSMCARLVDERIRGRANGVAMNGLMLGTLLGLPLATFVGEQLGWQAAFWTITLLTLVAAILTIVFVQNPAESDALEEARSMRDELTVLRRPQFLLALISSTLIIGATLGVVLGSAMGSALIPAYGLRAPIALGIVLAVLAIAVILPALTSAYLRTGDRKQSRTKERVTSAA